MATPSVAAKGVRPVRDQSGVPLIISRGNCLGQGPYVVGLSTLVMTTIDGNPTLKDVCIAVEDFRNWREDTIGICYIVMDGPTRGAMVTLLSSL